MVRKTRFKTLLKDPLKDLIEAPAAPAAPARLETKTARPAHGGAIGAVSQGIAEGKTQAVIELDPAQIRGGGLRDRLSDDPDDYVQLTEQILEYGQQVPILVRPHPDGKGDYQIVYGRRRVRACRDLGIRVKALVRDLDDRDLIVAQGQENTARRDLSYIEKANFARQMVEQGFKRKTICAALSVDKTEISRMLSVAARVPGGLIHAIGPAPGAGRDRWQTMAARIETAALPETEAARLAEGEISDQRFEALLRALTGPAGRRASKLQARKTSSATGLGQAVTAAGTLIGYVEEDPERIVLTLGAEDGFARWLASGLPHLYLAWQSRNDLPAGQAAEAMAPDPESRA